MGENLHSHSTLPEQLTGIWQRRKWLLMLAFALAFSAGVTLILALPPLYRSSTTLLLGQGDITASLVSASAGTEGIAARLDVINKAILSRARLQALIDRFDLYPRLRQQAPPESVIDRMRRDIGIKQETTNQQFDRNPNFTLTLSYQNQDAQLAASVANELATLYEQENASLRQQQSARTTAFLGQQLAEVSQRLAVQENLIRNFRNQHLGALPEQQGLNLTTLERLNAEVRLNGEKQLQLMTRNDALSTNPDAASFSAGSQAGLSRLDILRRQLAELRTHYTDKHPEIVRLKGEIKALEAVPPAKSGRSTGTPRQPPDLDSPGGLEEQQDALRANINELQHRIESTPEVDQELRGLNHEYDTIREQYLSLQKRHEEARLAESLEQQQHRQFLVLEPAIAANFPLAPQRLKLILMGLLLALGFSGGIALLAEQFDTSFHTLQDIRSFTNLPVLGSIARIEAPGISFQSGFKNTGKAIGMAICLTLIVMLAHKLGQHGEQLVWLLAGRSI